MKFVFPPSIKTVGKLDSSYGTAEIAGEQMIYSGGWKYTKENGGPITSYIMRQLTKCPEWGKALLAVEHDDNYDVVIDTRTNMLMEGMYPSIPGWHCDDVPRGEKYEQPNLKAIDNKVQHFMVLLSDSDECPAQTEFVTEPVLIDIDQNNVWNSVDKAVEEGKFKTGFLNEGDIIQFSQTAIHRASLCKTPGWRLFFRASITHRKPVNEIRRQVQVYSTRNGW